MTAVLGLVIGFLILNSRGIVVEDPTVGQCRVGFEMPLHTNEPTHKCVSLPNQKENAYDHTEHVHLVKSRHPRLSRHYRRQYSRINATGQRASPGNFNLRSLILLPGEEKTAQTALRSLSHGDKSLPTGSSVFRVALL